MKEYRIRLHRCAVASDGYCYGVNVVIESIEAEDDEDARRGAVELAEKKTKAR